MKILLIIPLSDIALAGEFFYAQSYYKRSNTETNINIDKKLK